MRPAPFGLLPIALILLVSPSAHAEPPAPTGPIFGVAQDTAPPPSAGTASVLAPIEVRLDYGAAAPCPDERALRSSVAANVGWDPFVTTAPRRLVVRIEHDDKGFEATMKIL